MVPRETGNNPRAKFLVEKQRVLWYVLYWLIKAPGKKLKTTRYKTNCDSYNIFFVLASCIASRL